MMRDWRVKEPVPIFLISGAGPNTSVNSLKAVTDISAETYPPLPPILILGVVPQLEEFWHESIPLAPKSQVRIFDTPVNEYV